MEWWLIIIVILVIWWISKSYYKPKHSTNTSAFAEDEITEEVVLEGQLDFEKDFEYAVGCGVPDSMSGRQTYIYRNLMSVWYSKLSSDNRYDDKMIQKIRKDWLDYMDSLKDENTYNFLSESEDKEKADSYGKKGLIASNKVWAIENAFASLIGKKAVDELARIRGLSYFDFNKNGNLAPDGFEFDSKGKLHKKNK